METRCKRALGWFTVTAILPLAGHALAETATLEGFWRMNEGAGPTCYDETDNHYDGQLVQDGSSPSWGPGYLDFDGATHKYGHVEVSGMPSFSTYGSFSVFARFRLTGPGYLDYEHWLACKHGPSNYVDDEWELAVTADRRPYIKIHAPSADALAIAPEPVEYDEWHVVGGVLDAENDQLMLYLDGYPIAVTPTSINQVRETTWPVYFGNVYYWAGDDTWNPLQGDLDWVTIYDGIPEPTSLGLLAVGGLGLLGRRRAS